MLTFRLAGLGATLPSRFAYDPARVQVTVTPTGALTKGMCSADGQYIWDTTQDGTGYWRRLNAGEQCVGTATSGPAVRTGGGGGVTVADVLSYRTLELQWRAKYQALQRPDFHNALALAAHLPPCPAGATADSDKTCYDQTPIPFNENLVLAPGTFNVFRVPFHISEIQSDGHFQKTITPDADQQSMIDFQMVYLSQAEYAPFMSVDNHSSVQKVMDLRPDDFRLSVDGFSLNPTVQPTAAEMTGENGFRLWVARGGYPLSLRAMGNGTDGPMAYDKPATFTVCASLRCACPVSVTRAAGDAFETTWGVPADQQINALPRCIGGAITKKGIQTGIIPANEQYEWDVYLSMGPSPHERTISIRPHDPSWWQKMGGWLESQMEKLAGIFCAAQPAVQQQLQQTQTEKCIDKQQKPCIKGSAGCTCIAPPMMASASVNATNAWMAYWCKQWAAENAPAPQYEAPISETPQVPPEMQVPLGLRWWQWGLVVGAGIGAGGLFFSKRTP